METKPATWQDRFGLTTCSAQEIEKKIPAAARGVAVIYVHTDGRENILLIVESRAGTLRSQCGRRLQTAKLPPISELTISFKAETLGDTSPEALHAACREQVIFASVLRRELRPAMR